MADNEPKQSIPTNFPGNSYSNPGKKKVTVESKTETKKIVQGNVVQRKKFGTKLRESFTGDDAKSIGHFILFDLAIPQIKNVLFDVLTQSTRRALWGGNQPVQKTQSGYTSYSNMYGRSQMGQQAGPKAVPSPTKVTHDFSEYVLSQRADAEAVIGELQQRIAEYGVARVSDVKDLLGMTSNYVEQNWGWTNLDSASSDAVYNGFVVILPRPHVIE